MFSRRIVPIVLVAAWVGLESRSHWKRYKRCEALVESNIGFDGIGWSSNMGYYAFNSKAEEAAEKISACADKNRVYVDAWGNAYRRDPVLSCHTSCTKCWGTTVRFVSKKETNSSN